MREREHEIFSEVENMSSLRLFVSNVSVERDCWEPDNDVTYILWKLHELVAERMQSETFE